MVITVKDMTKRFGSLTAVREANFTVKKGEVVGFVGANGAGKSTTINALLGFIAPTAGQIELFSRTVKPSSAHQQHQQIGFASGDMELPARLTGKQYLQFVSHQSKADTTERLADLSQRFKPQLNKKIGSLSRGNKQKIALMAAFLTNPKLVILDEPTSGLDPIMQEAFLGLVRQETARGTTIFMSSHYLGEVADVCSRIILMREGQIIKDISASGLLNASGKQVRVVTGYKPTRPPKGASSVKKTKLQNGQVAIEFIYKQPASDLQLWLAGVKQLADVEISEYNLDGIVSDMYGEEMPSQELES